MSFACSFCSKKVPSGVSANKIVTAYRQYIHPTRPKAMTRKVIKNGKKKNEYVTDPGGLGLQIAREVSACPSCANNWIRKQRENQGITDNQIPKVVIPLPALKEISPEPKRFKRY